MLSTLATFLEDYTEGLIEVTREEGREEGREEEHQASNERIVLICSRAVLAYVDSNGCSLDKAMEIIGVPDEVYDRVRSLALEKISSENNR